MAKQKFNPLLPKRFQEISTASGGGEDLAATLVLGRITGGSDIELSGIGVNADIIRGVGTTNVLSLNEPDAGGWSISSDDTAYGESYVYGDSTSAYLAAPDCFFIANTNNIYLYHGGAGFIGKSVSRMSITEIGIFDKQLVTTGYNLHMESVAVSSATSTALEQMALFLNSGGAAVSTSNIGISNSLALGGIGLTINIDNTAYANQISLQPSGNLFNGLLVPPALSGDQTYTFQDASGTVAFLSDTTGYIQTATTVNATPFELTSPKEIAFDSVQSFITRVTAISTVLGNVWCHEYRGAIKQISGVTSIVDTVTDELIAEDIATATWSTAITASSVPVSNLSITVTGAAINIKWKVETIFSEIVI